MTTKNNNGLTGLTPDTFYAENSTNTTDFQMNADFIKLNYDKTTTPTEFKISPSGIYWNNGTSNYTTGLGKVAALDTVFASVKLPPNATTLKIDDTILLDDGVSTLTTSLSNTIIQLSDPSNSFINYSDASQLILTRSGTGITIDGSAGGNIAFNDGTAGPYIQVSPSTHNFLIHGNNTSVDINSTSFTTRIGDIDSGSNGTVFGVSDNLRLIDQNAVNNTFYNGISTQPVCYTTKNSGSFSYTGNSGWQEMFHFTVPIPSIACDVNSSFNQWKIEFSLNCRNQANTDKALAMYFALEDAASNFYTPFLFNQSTPFTRHANNSTYNNTASDMQPYSWSDYVDLTGVNNNVPLEFRFYWYGDNSNTPDYDMVLSLTRTNII